MDRNSVIGFTLIILLVITYVFYNQKVQDDYYAKKHADSVAYVKTHPKAALDTTKAIVKTATANIAIADSTKQNLPSVYNGTAQNILLQNKKLAIQFTTKGAFPLSAEIKAYKTYDQKSLFLFNGAGNQLNTILPINNGSVATADLYFTPQAHTEPNGDQSISFNADLGNGKLVNITYTLPADDYLMQCKIHLTGMPTNSLVMNWQTLGNHTEKDINNERLNCQMYYRYKNGDNDYFTIKSDDRKTVSESTISWVGSTILSCDEGFSKADIAVSNAAKDSNIAAKSSTTFDIPLKASNNQQVNLKWYIGPNDYKTFNLYKMGFDDMVPLGYGIMAFVKYVNKWLLIPIFYFLSSFITNYGIIIMLMTVIIRLILSFFTYKSYLSAAKMRVLKPEIDELRAKYGDDQQKFGTEQMKLYRSAGVNPLGGCLPTLFQIPILFAMYYMFPSFMEFRQKPFLWAHDLSTYDSIWDFGFTIPWYGDHMSLFTLLMTATSLFLALYNKNMTTQDPNNPALKYMPFIFPFLLLGVFNKMAAALTFYYTFSNIISIVMQFVIQKYFIDEKAIHAQLQENKNKPATPSKWAAKLEEMQKLQQTKAKSGGKK
jgi:YidC/Oxa1 family membrane protein insertase